METLSPEAALIAQSRSLEVGRIRGSYHAHQLRKLEDSFDQKRLESVHLPQTPEDRKRREADRKSLAGLRALVGTSAFAPSLAAFRASQQLAPPRARPDLPSAGAQPQRLSAALRPELGAAPAQGPALSPRDHLRAVLANPSRLAAYVLDQAPSLKHEANQPAIPKKAFDLFEDLRTASSSKEGAHPFSPRLYEGEASNPKSKVALVLAKLEQIVASTPGFSTASAESAGELLDLCLIQALREVASSDPPARAAASGPVDPLSREKVKAIDIRVAAQFDRLQAGFQKPSPLAQGGFLEMHELQAAMPRGPHPVDFLAGSRLAALKLDLSKPQAKEALLRLVQVEARALLAMSGGNVREVRDSTEDERDALQLDLKKVDPTIADVTQAALNNVLSRLQFPLDAAPPGQISDSEMEFRLQQLDRIHEELLLFQEAGVPFAVIGQALVALEGARTQLRDADFPKGFNTLRALTDLTRGDGFLPAIRFTKASSQESFKVFSRISVANGGTGIRTEQDAMAVNQFNREMAGEFARFCQAERWTGPPPVQLLRKEMGIAFKPGVPERLEDLQALFVSKVLSACEAQGLDVHAFLALPDTRRNDLIQAAFGQMAADPAWIPKDMDVPPPTPPSQ